MFYGVVDYMRTHKPRAAVLENVRSLVHNRDGEDICEVLHQLLRLDCYNIQWRVLNTRYECQCGRALAPRASCLRSDSRVRSRPWARGTAAAELEATRASA